MKIKISDYIDNTKLLIFLPDKIMVEMIKRESLGIDFIEIEDSILRKAEKAYNEMISRDLFMDKTAALNNKGINFEEKGDIVNAIICYEECMDLMYTENTNKIAWHSPERLRILYKKTGNNKEYQFLVKFVDYCNAWNLAMPEIYNKRLKQLISQL